MRRFFVSLYCSLGVVGLYLFLYIARYLLASISKCEQPVMEHVQNECLQEVKRKKSASLLLKSSCNHFLDGKIRRSKRTNKENKNHFPNEENAGSITNELTYGFNDALPPALSLTLFLSLPPALTRY